jgi:predicted DCC family thiol-disulfide oxidoreductase YuxK/uncharacterized membrane protein YphA (DoxX/SURF4 family)
MRRLLARLDRHWFAPASLRDLALARIVIVGAQLIFFLPALSLQHSLAHVDAVLYKPLIALKVLLLPFGGWGARPDDMFLHAAWIAAIASGILGVLGLHTRPALLVFAATNTILQTHTYSYGEQHHSEALMMLALWVLALSPAGEAWSLDDLELRTRLAKRTMRFECARPEEYQSPFARWPLRLIQWLFALVYCSAGLEKVTAGGLDWYNGYTLAYYLLQDGVRNQLPLNMELVRHPNVLFLVSIGAAVFELTFFLAILVPALALPFVAYGMAFHTGIWVLQRAPFFQLLALYIVFLEPIRDHWPRWLRPAPRPAPPPWTLIYDERCPLCLRSMTILDYLDVRGRLAFVDLDSEMVQRMVPAAVAPTDLRIQMHLVGPDGRAYGGFFAFRALTRLLPPLWLLLPIAYCPGAAWIGTRAYTLIAANRARVPCRTATCSLA